MFQKVVLLLLLLTLTQYLYPYQIKAKESSQLDSTDTVSEKFGFSIPEEEELGFEAMITLVKKYGYYTNADVNNYISYVGKKIADTVSKRPNIDYMFVILNTDEINAFACPGGYILITKGILKVIRNEAELAGVLGHEIAHVEEGHGLQSIASDPLAKEKLSVMKNAVQNGEGYKKKFVQFLQGQQAKEPVSKLVNFEQIKEILTSQRELQIQNGSAKIE